MKMYRYNISADDGGDWAKASADFLITPDGVIDNVDDLRIHLDSLGWDTVAFKQLPAFTEALADHPWLSGL